MELVMESLIDDAVAAMDRCVGPRRSAEAISGRPLRTRKRSEDPEWITYRFLIRPYMEAFGKRYIGGVSCRGESCVVLCYVPMNHPLDDALRRMSSSMSGAGVPDGLSTDGFRWACARLEDGSPRVDRVFDLRPYYTEALDRRRFRAAVPEDRGGLRDFEARMRDIG